MSDSEDVLNGCRIPFILLLVLSSISLLVTSCGPSSHQETGPGSPQGLLCDLLRWPEDAVITDMNPEFSWVVSDPRQGACQSAYQIQVGSDRDLLSRNQGDFWDSGQVPADRSTAVRYQGRELVPGNSYWWKVRTWDASGVASPWSSPQRFTISELALEERRWPGESRWIQTSDGRWVLEDRQRSEFQEIAPRKLVRLGPGHFFVDFGRAAFATLRIQNPGPQSPTTTTILLGERATGDLRVDTNPGRSNIGFSRIGLELPPDREDILLQLPRHVSRFPHSQTLPEHVPEVTPFRYAEIEGWPGELEAGEVRQLALFYPFDDGAASFQCSDERLKAVWDLCRYTLKATPFLSLYADGNRERMPYEADAYIQQLGHYAVDREFAVARYTNQFLLWHATWPTEWQMHSVLSAWADFAATGDARFLEENYTGLKVKTLLELAREDGLISTRTGLVTQELFDRLHFSGTELVDIVDWPAGTPEGERQASNRGPTPEGERDGFDFRAVNAVVNAFHYRSLKLMEEIASRLGKDEDSRYFAQRSELVRRSFQISFFDPERQIYVDGEGSGHSSLHANMFALAFGLVPDECRDPVVQYVVSRGMACSVYGAQYLLEALYDNGQSQVALDLLRSDTRRSWLNMIRAGSTMTTESWDEYFKPNSTWNHAWGSAPANIIARKLMGVEPLEPGFRRIRIRPQPADLGRASIQIPTITGNVRCDWRRVPPNRFRFEIVIPANTKGEVWLPSSSLEQLREGDRPISSADHVKVISTDPEWTVCTIESGRYRFQGPLSQQLTTPTNLP